MGTKFGVLKIRRRPVRKTGGQDQWKGSRPGFLGLVDHGKGVLDFISNEREMMEALVALKGDKVLDFLSSQL